MSDKFNLFITAAILILAGCAREIQKPIEVCPGKESVSEVLAALQSNSQNIVSLKAYGQCRLHYYIEGKNKPSSENVNVKLWINPPFEIYLQGDAALVPKAIVLGSNEQEFWLSLRPKEISTYWWGQWSQQDSSEKLLINPKTLLDALGIVQVDAEENWILSNDGTFDILTKQDRDRVIKKMYIYSCDYRVGKIEYFDSNGEFATSAELADYQEVSEGFFVPALITINTHAKNKAEDSLSIILNLKSVQPTIITEKQQNVLFNRPQPRGFKDEYRIVNGRWIKQSQ